MFNKGATLAAALFTASSLAWGAESNDVLIAKGLCYEIVGFINLLFVVSPTECLPALGNDNVADFVFVTEKPVFSLETT